MYKRQVVAGHLVIGDVVPHPGCKRRIALSPLLETDISRSVGCIVRRGEIAAHPLNFRFVHDKPGVPDVLPFRFDLLTEGCLLYTSRCV